MCLEPEDFEEWFERTQSLPTENLHRLDLYWRDNFETSVDQELHSIVETVLAERGETTLSMQRQENIKKLNKSMRVSNAFGRIIAGITGFLVRSK